LEHFIVKLGNAITTALGISSEATTTIMAIGMVWFYFFRWKPAQAILLQHADEESDANGSYTTRAEARDRVTSEIKELLIQVNKLLDDHKDNLSTLRNEMDKATTDRVHTNSTLEIIKTDVTRISTIISMSPNARSLQ